MLTYCMHNYSSELVESTDVYYKENGLFLYGESWNECFKSPDIIYMTVYPCAYAVFHIHTAQCRSKHKLKKGKHYFDPCACSCASNACVQAIVMVK